MKTEMSEDGEITVTAETKEEAKLLLEWEKKNQFIVGDHQHVYDSQNLTFDARLAWSGES